MFPGLYSQFLCCFGFPALEFPRGCSWCHPAGRVARIPRQGTAVAARKAMRKELFNLYILHKNYPELVCNCSFYVIY